MAAEPDENCVQSGPISSPWVAATQSSMSGCRGSLDADCSRNTHLTLREKVVAMWYGPLDSISCASVILVTLAQQDKKTVSAQRMGLKHKLCQVL